MSSTACQDSGVVALRFFQLHSTSVLLRLWMPWMKSAAAWLHLNFPLGHSHSLDLMAFSQFK